MYIDASFDFGLAAHAAPGTVASTNVFDAGSAKILFQAGRGLKVWGRQTFTAGSDPTFYAEFVASDHEALDADHSEANDTDVLASTGTMQTASDGTDLANGDTVEFNFEVRNQTKARQYYGLHTTTGGTSTTMSAGECYGVFDVQTNMPGAQAAVPAT